MARLVEGDDRNQVAVLPANVNDLVEALSLLHGQENDAHGDAGYQGAAKRPDARPGVNWHIAMRPGKRKALGKTHPVQSVADQSERLKASIRAKVELGSCMG